MVPPGPPLDDAGDLLDELDRMVASILRGVGLPASVAAIERGLRAITGWPGATVHVGPHAPAGHALAPLIASCGTGPRPATSAEVPEVLGCTVDGRTVGRALGVPLVTRAGVAGVVVLDDPVERPVEPGFARRVGTVCDLLSNALDRHLEAVDPVSLDELRAMTRTIFDHLDESVAVIAMGAQRRVVFVNSRLADALGRPADEIVGADPQLFFDVFGVEMSDAIWEAAEAGRPWQGDLVAHLGPRTAVVQVTAQPFRFPQGERALLVTGTDVSEARVNERALRESEERARVIMAAAPIGMAVSTPANEIVEVNDALRAMLRLPDATPDQFDVVNRVEPEDIPRHLAALEAVGVGELPSYELEVRLRRGDGTWMWALVSVAGVGDVDGRPRLLVGQVLDISERRAAEQQLRRVADELRKANQVKNQFLSRMSHELRTPLNAVLGYGQLLALEPLTEEQHESIEHIVHAGRHLLGLIDEVLDLARLDAGAATFETTVLQVRDVISEALRMVRPMADDHRIPIVVDPGTAADQLPVIADHRRLVQVLVNLLTNGIKYNRPGGRVEVAATATDARVRLVVSDTGRGIPPDKMARVFEPFDRLGADQLGIEGSGIGLALARSLVEHMDGDLTVVSEEGVGSAFTVELPLATRPPADTASPTPSARPGVAVDVDLEDRVVVLSVEDNVVNQRLIEAIARLRPDIELHHASSGGEGLDRASSLHPDLVLLDLHLPDMPGTDVVTRLRELPGARPHVAIVSADANPDQIDAALALGADRYLTKPVDVAEVLGVFDEVARRLRAREPSPDGHTG